MPTGPARILAGDGRARSNSAGVLVDPGGYLRTLEATRELIDQAIALHAATNWPDESDYHEL